MSAETQKLLAMGAAGLLVVVAFAYLVWPTPSEAPVGGGEGTIEVEAEGSASSNSDTKTAEATAPTKSTGTAPKGTSSPAPLYGSYEPYAEEKVAYPRVGRVVLFFNSASCEGCKRLDTDIRARLKEIPRDLKILDVNFDAEIALREKYGLMTPHALIQVDADGVRISQWTGSLTLLDIITRLASFRYRSSF